MVSTIMRKIRTFISHHQEIKLITIPTPSRWYGATKGKFAG